jgi:hypothetical protein
MGGWADRFGAILLDASLAATAVLSVVALAMLACRQPGRRIALARAGIVASLLVLPLVGLAPLPRVAVQDLLRHSPLGASPLLEPAGGVESRMGRGGWPGGPSSSVPQAPARGPATWLSAHRVARVVVPLYLALAALRLGWLLLGYWGVRWVMRSSLPPTADVEALYHGLQPGRPAPALRVSDRVRRPVLVGLFRQTILIPTPLGQPEARSQLRLSLLHELAHAQARDSAFGLASGLAQAAWFFLPPLWWVLAQLRLDQEFLADRRAAGEFGTLPNYASSLVNLAEPRRPAQPREPAAPSGGTTRGSVLFQRVLMLVHCPFPIEARPPLWWRGLLSALVLLGTLGASVLTVRSPARPGGPAPRQTASGSVPRAFRMSRLVVYPRRLQGHGRTSFLEVPIRMPEQFELTVEAWGTPASLAETRIIGRSLGDPDQPPPTPPPPARWHRVRIRRDAQGLLAIGLDGQVIVAPTPASTPGWLTFESPAHSVAHFRNLLLTW